MGYGTGAIMCVPGHDERDFEFARKFGLPIVQVVSRDGSAYDLEAAEATEGIAVNSGQWSGLTTAEFKKEIGRWLEEKGIGRPTVNYRLRDWLISRQRYWGAPIPIVHCPACGEVPVPEAQLPVLLPDVENYQPSGTGESPLAAIPEFVQHRLPELRRPGPARDRHHGRLRLLFLVFPALRRPRQRQGLRRRGRPSTTGCRWTCTPAASSMPAPTCSMPASGPRCCSTKGCWASRSPS